MQYKSLIDTTVAKKEKQGGMVWFGFPTESHKQ